MSTEEGGEGESDTRETSSGSCVDWDKESLVTGVCGPFQVHLECSEDGRLLRLSVVHHSDGKKHESVFDKHALNEGGFDARDTMSDNVKCVRVALAGEDH